MDYEARKNPHDQSGVHLVYTSTWKEEAQEEEGHVLAKEFLVIIETFGLSPKILQQLARDLVGVSLVDSSLLPRGNFIQEALVFVLELLLFLGGLGSLGQNATEVTVFLVKCFSS
jgi:hypothetical protein